MSPMMFPFLTGMVPPLVKEKLGPESLRPELISDPNPMMEEERRPIVEEVTRVGQPVGIGNLQQAFMQRDPLSRLGQFINQELAEENQEKLEKALDKIDEGLQTMKQKYMEDKLRAELSMKDTRV